MQLSPGSPRDCVGHTQMKNFPVKTICDIRKVSLKTVLDLVEEYNSAKTFNIKAKRTFYDNEHASKIETTTSFWYLKN